MQQELWVETPGEQTFCLAGPMGDAARSLLGPTALLVWTVEGRSHFEAMTKYYEHMGWGAYTTDLPEWDCVTYADHGWE
ncbi:MAG: hypothetical protein ACRDWV_01645 [Acidimicrobiales bacterium]